jgi:hypothetical protein
MPTSAERNESDARVVSQARAKIADLLAVAYRRLVAARGTQDVQTKVAKPGLANSLHSSVHGVVV